MSFSGFPPDKDFSTRASARDDGMNIEQHFADRTYFTTNPLEDLLFYRLIVISGTTFEFLTLLDPTPRCKRKIFSSPDKKSCHHRIMVWNRPKNNRNAQKKTQIRRCSYFA